MVIEASFCYFDVDVSWLSRLGKQGHVNLANKP